MADQLKVPVYAFTGSFLFKTKEGKMDGTPIFDGTMIRAEDVYKQTTRLSLFEHGKTPQITRK